MNGFGQFECFRKLTRDRPYKRTISYELHSHEITFDQERDDFNEPTISVNFHYLYDSKGGHFMNITCM